MPKIELFIVIIFNFNRMQTPFYTKGITNYTLEVDLFQL